MCTCGQARLRRKPSPCFSIFRRLPLPRRSSLRGFAALRHRLRSAFDQNFSTAARHEGLQFPAELTSLAVCVGHQSLGARAAIELACASGPSCRARGRSRKPRSGAGRTGHSAPGCTRFGAVRRVTVSRPKGGRRVARRAIFGLARRRRCALSARRGPARPLLPRQRL
jgi:hypothetical protein